MEISQKKIYKITKKDIINNFSNVDSKPSKKELTFKWKIFIISVAYLMCILVIIGLIITIFYL